MDCPQTDTLVTAEYLMQFNRKATQQRVPLAGSIELTRRCNLNCVHCYLGPPSGRASEHWELTTAQWLSILDQATEAGCLELLMTGGEPLLRPDFAAVYRHAKHNGLLITVFTNGTLVTAEVAALFADLPPRQVEVSLYGATAATYERIAGVQGSFERCMSGLRRLLDARLHVGLKTVLMTLNRQEFSAIQHMAETLGVEFRFDAAIFPRLDGDKTPVRLRVPAREAVAREMADETAVQKWRDFFRRQGAITPSGALYQCAAGVTAFHVDAAGSLRPCLMVAEPSCSLLDHSFRTGWDTVIPLLRERKPRAGFVCGTCAKRALCGYCPAYFTLENGAEDVCSEYLCALGRLRYEAIAPIAKKAAQEQREGGCDELRNPAAEEAALREAQAPSH